MSSSRRVPVHGWLGLTLVAVFWPINWLVPGLRTHWAFFPLWLGFCLAVDGLNVSRTGTSLWTRSRAGYASLFLISIPFWWLFELINLRTRNWSYVGRAEFTDVEYALLASLSFSTVVPAVMGAAELAASFGWIRRLGRGPTLGSGPRVQVGFTATGLVMLGLLLAWPRLFYPFVWLSVFLLLEPLNLRLGNRSLTCWTRRGDWRPVAALAVGVLVCGFFWEMWNWLSYPKWVYTVPIFGFWKVFEMPLLGYLGYVPFSLELFAGVHFILGLFGRGAADFLARSVAPR